MYTVVRFCHRNGNVLKALGDKLSAIIPGIFDEVDTKRKRFCSSVSSDGNWWSHRRDILEFLKKCAMIMTDARRHRVEVQFDVAIRHDDYKKKIVTSFFVDTVLLKALTKHHATLVFSVYE